MIKELMHDPIFLAGKSEVATKEDLQVAQDLLDTLMAHRESCVGMAANMIGVRKRIIAFLDESGRAPTYTVMLNPEIIKKDGAYDTNHVSCHTDTTFSVCHQRLKQVLCDLQIFFRCDLRLPCKEYRIVHQFFYHFLTCILLYY